MRPPPAEFTVLALVLAFACATAPARHYRGEIVSVRQFMARGGEAMVEIRIGWYESEHQFLQTSGVFPLASREALLFRQAGGCVAVVPLASGIRLEPCGVDDQP